jgi:Mg-chelatase subunit ChlD/tetratricopeptide (TPR) repeat protein
MSTIDTHTGDAARRPSLRRFAMLVAAVLAFALLVVWAARRPKPPVRARAIGAELDLAAGEVTVKEAGREFGATSGTPLAVGSRVVTGKGSRALVRSSDGAAIFLRGESEIALDARGFEIARGEVWLDAPRTDAEPCVARAGGTLVSASDAGASIRRAGEDVVVYVARGLAVLASPGGRVEINAGEQGTTKSGKAPVIEPVAFWQDWTGGMGDHRGGQGADASGRLYGVDPTGALGTAARPLAITKQSVRAVVRNAIAETEVDQTFANSGSQPVEGWYWFTVPARASVTSFALETDGVLVEGEVIERSDAAAKYAAAVRQTRDPALLEWIDGRTYRARIFPVPAAGTRRVVLRYLELLPRVDGKMKYVYPLRSEEAVHFEEFSIAVDLGPEGASLEVATSLDARIEDGGRRVSMRRSGYVPRADFEVEMKTRSRDAARAWRFASGGDQADYVMLRYVPEVDWSSLPKAKGEVVVVVDTSASGDEAQRQLRTATAEAILRALSEDDRFAVVALDVKPKVLYPAAGLAAASEGEIARGLEKLSEHASGGATDLGAMFETALERLHGAEQPAIVYVGDGVPTSGEIDADGLADRLRRTLSGSRARLFCVGVGEGARHDLMQELARTGGGQHLRVDSAEEATGQALRLTSALKTPTITDLTLDLGAGLDQPFYSTSGKVSRGEEVVVLARTHHPLPPKVVVRGRLGGKDFGAEHAISAEGGVAASLVPRLWASEYIHRLLGSNAEAHRAEVLGLGLEYGLITPYTSSLALESEAAYAQQGVRRRASTLRGVRLTSIAKDGDEEVAALVATSPAVVMGCDSPRLGKAAQEEPSTEGATGSRAKGESASAAGDAPGRRYGVPGPAAAEPAPSVTAAPASGGIGDAMGLMAPAQAPVPRVAGAARNVAAKAGAHGRDQTDKRADAKAKREPDDKNLSSTLAIAIAIAKRPLGRCSDAASRPLPERVVLWKKRLDQLGTAAEWAQQFDAAHDACELADWRDQAALLDLIQQKIDTEQGAEIALTHFSHDPDAQQFLARGLLRRVVDVRIAAAVSRVLFGGRVDWAKVDRELLDVGDPQKRLVKLKTAMLAAPGDPAGEVRLVKLLARTGNFAEALGYGRRLRDRGFLTPTLAEQLGDVLAEEKLTDEAMRTYSELVEFDQMNLGSRRLLGDIYLRHGWYAEAYRQYKGLTTIGSKETTDWIRLASAAAGAGRVDEALRIERDVASGAGQPGPNDPRYFARLWSAARLGALLDAKDAQKDAVGRKMKDLHLFTGPGTLALLTWEDLEARLVLASADEKKETLAGEATDAGAVGLTSLMLSPNAFAQSRWAVRFKADPPERAVKFTVVTLTWNGESFTVNTHRSELARGVKQTGI